MTYNYDETKKDLYTDKGQRMFLEIRDNIRELLKISGAFMMDNATINVAGDSFLKLACIDRLIELNEIELIYNEGHTQNRVYIKY